MDQSLFNLRVKLQSIYRKGLSSTSDWDVRLLEMTQSTLHEFQSGAVVVDSTGTNNALLCARWLLYGSYRPCVKCSVVRQHECIDCQYAEQHIYLAHLLLSETQTKESHVKIRRQLVGQISARFVLRPPRWSLVLRTILLMRWSSPKQIVDLLFAMMCDNCTEDNWLVLFCIAMCLCQHPVTARCCPISQMCTALGRPQWELNHEYCYAQCWLCVTLCGEDVMSSVFPDQQARVQLEAYLSAVPWISRWVQTEAVWRCLPLQIRAVGLCLANHIPLFPMECILSERENTMAPMASIRYMT